MGLVFDSKIDSWVLCGIYRVRYILVCDGKYEVIVLVNNELFFGSLWSVSVMLYKYSFFYYFGLLVKVCK